MTDAWDGRPQNPERDGWHWLHHPEDIRPIVQPWDAEYASWISGAMYSPQGVVDLGFRYLGPALLPAEVAAREAAAAEEMRAAYCTALNTLNCVIHEEDNDPPDVAHAIEIARRGHAEALAICTPDGPSPDALARALDQARREGMEAAARIAAERGAWASNDADAESLVDRLEARGRMDAAGEIAAAIRAAMEREAEA